MCSQSSLHFLREGGRGRPPKSVGMAAQRHANLADTEPDGEKAACTLGIRVQAAFFRGGLRCGF